MLFDTLVNTLSNNTVQLGGAVAKRVVVNPYVMFMVIAIVLLIKAFVAMWSYNEVAPDLLGRPSQLSYMKALALVILFDTLLH